METETIDSEGNSVRQTGRQLYASNFPILILRISLIRCQCTKFKFIIAHTLKNADPGWSFNVNDFFGIFQLSLASLSSLSSKL